MPSEARRLHRFTVVSRALRLARQLLLPAILGGASAGDDFGNALQWIFLILAVPSILVAIAQWMVFRFRVEGEDLVIDSGVLSRRRRVIPLGRVQNIDLEQSILERMAGVAELRLETASGGRETEASLTVLGLEEAQQLQVNLLELRAAALRRSAPASPPAATDDGLRSHAASAGHVPAVAQSGQAATEPTQRPLLRLSTADLAIAGATSNEAGLIAAGMATLIEVADDIVGLTWLGSWLEAVFSEGARIGVAGALSALVFIVAAFIVLGWLSSILVTVVRFHGFTLIRQGTNLRREYGLFSRHRSTVPLERVQAVRVEETLLRRALGLAALKIETAGASPRQQGGDGGGRAEAFVPIARRNEVGRLLSEVFEDARFDDVEMNPVSPLSRRRSFNRLAIPITLLTVGLAVLVDRSWAALALLLVPAWLLAHAQYRARGWARPAGYTVVRNGVTTRTSWVVPERKIQTLHLQESPFQRRRDLGTLIIDTAAGGRAARVVDLVSETGIGLLVDLASDADTARREALSSSRAG